MTDKRENWTCVWMLVALIVLGIVGIGAVVSWEENKWFQESQHRYDNLTLAQLSELSCLEFPASARLVSHRVARGILGYDIHARVEMDRRDVPAFVKSIKRGLGGRDEMFKLVLSRTDRLRTTKADIPGAPDWWLTDSPKHFIAATSGNRLDLLIDLDRSDKAVVYVYRAK